MLLPACSQAFAHVQVPVSHLRLLLMDATKDGCILLVISAIPASLALCGCGYCSALAFGPLASGVLGGDSGVWIANVYDAVVKAEWIDLPGLLGHLTSYNFQGWRHAASLSRLDVMIDIMCDVCERRWHRQQTQVGC